MRNAILPGTEKHYHGPTSASKCHPDPRSTFGTLASSDNDAYYLTKHTTHKQESYVFFSPPHPKTKKKKDTIFYHIIDAVGTASLSMDVNLNINIKENDQQNHDTSSNAVPLSFCFY